MSFSPLLVEFLNDEQLNQAVNRKKESQHQFRLTVKIRPRRKNYSSPYHKNKIISSFFGKVFGDESPYLHKP
jgi:hypothetical protein